MSIANSDRGALLQSPGLQGSAVQIIGCQKEIPAGQHSFLESGSLSYRFFINPVTASWVVFDDILGSLRSRFVKMFLPSD